MHGCESSPELKNKADALIAKVARTTSRSRVSRSRLAKFSHAQLLEIAVEACEGSRELKNKADALIAPGGAAPIVVRGYLAVAGPAAAALRLAWALRARSCGRVHHLVACLQQAAAEVPLHQPEGCTAAG